ACTDGLIHQDRQVLGHGMAKVRSEHANVKTAAISHANHCFGIDLISNPEARSKRGEFILDIASRVERPFSGNSDHPTTTSAASNDVGEAPLVLTVHVFGCVI